MKIEKILFGQHQNEDVWQYILTNDAMSVKVITYGATISAIDVTNSTEKVGLVCGFDTLEGYFGEEYLANAPYFGCTVGRIAGRIKDGKFSVNGEDYTLALNNGSNHLHGGIVGFDKRNWKATETSSTDAVAVTMSLLSPDMEEGFPGNVEAKVTFTLSSDNNLTIDYNATTDKTTPISMTNHSYFNLSGFTETIENTTAQVFASEFLTPDDGGVPTGARTAVAGLPCDLQKPTQFSEALKDMETGFEHYYAFPKGLGKLETVAKFSHPASGRELSIETTEPGALLYSGYFTSDTLKRESGDQQYGRYRAFCFESHRFPNGVNLVGAEGAFTTPDAPYTNKTVYKFTLPANGTNA